MHTVVFYTRVKERDGVIVKFVTNLSGLTSGFIACTPATKSGGG